MPVYGYMHANETGMDMQIFISEHPVMMPAMKSTSGMMLIIHQSRALLQTCCLTAKKKKKSACVCV